MKRSFNTIKAGILILIIAILSIITVIKIKPNKKFTNTSTPPIQENIPKEKLPYNSQNKDLINYNTIGGSGNETLHNVHFRDYYYVIFSTNSIDYDFKANKGDSLFISKVDNNNTILDTIVIGNFIYKDSLIGDFLTVLVEREILYMDLDLNIIKKQSLDNMCSRLIQYNNKIYTYCENQGVIINVDNLSQFNLQTNNFKLTNTYNLNNDLYMFFQGDYELIVLKFDGETFYEIISLIADSIVGINLLNNEFFVASINDNNFIITKIDMFGNIGFVYETGFNKCNYFYVIKKTNGYTIYMCDKIQAIKIFVCLHGDLIKSTNLEYKSLYKTINYTDSYVVVAETIANNASLLINDKEIIINGGVIKNAIFMTNNMLFCQSDGSNIDFIENHGKSDIFIFKLNI